VTDDEKEKRTLVKGQHVFPFELRWGGETLPGSIKSCQGRIQYKLVLYVKPWVAEFSASEKEIKVSGYLNLNHSFTPSLYQPLITTAKKSKSFFSSRTVIKVDFILEKRGFIQGENMKFQMNVQNLDVVGEIIEKLSVAILQKMSYTDNNFSKCTRVVIKTKEAQCQDPLTNGEIYWEESIRIPIHTRPTFNIDVHPKKNGTVETNYFVQVIN